MLIAAGGNEKILRGLFLQWSSLGDILFRGLLRLRGKKASGLSAEAVIAEAEKEYNVSLAGFSRLSRMRQDKKNRIEIAVADMLLEPLMSLVQTVDAMDGNIP